jgi:arylsulfatase A
MEQTDATAGKILQALEAHGFRENTIVIFTADNGAERYAYDRIRNFQHRSSGPLRGLKRDLWEGGHRMPFVVRWPGVVAAGEVSTAMTSQVDIMATLAAITGYKLPAGSAEDSRDLLAVWKNRAPSPRRTLVHNTQPDGYAVRHDQWVLIAAKTGAVTRVPPWFDQENNYPKHDQPGELYDLSKDLAQRNNLYAQEPAKVAELQALLKTLRVKGDVR